MGTGGNNLPVLIDPLAYSVREDAKANTFSATELDRSNALSALQPSPQSHHAQMFIVEGATNVVRVEGNDRVIGPLTALGMSCAKGTETTDSGHYVIEETVYGQTGFSKYTEGATTLTATTYKRPEDNVVVREITPSAE
jgi:hypothetical protein